MEFTAQLSNLEQVFTHNELKHEVYTKNMDDSLNGKYVNQCLATPILKPVKGKIDIPPLEGFPSPAIPLGDESLMNLGLTDRVEHFRLSPDIDSKFTKLQVNLEKKNISYKSSTTPNVAYATSPSSEIQSISTFATTNIQNTENSEFTMVLSEDESDSVQGHLGAKKAPKSKERKLSSEGGITLPPRAEEDSILRPHSKKTIISSSKLLKDQQALMPTTILGFLQKSVKDLKQGNTKKRVEKAGLKSLEALNLTTSIGEVGSRFPSFTLG